MLYHYVRQEWGKDVTIFHPGFKVTGLLSKARWTLGPTLCLGSLSIDILTYVLKVIKLSTFEYSYPKNSPKAGEKYS